jgi:hypothetical protein
MDREVEPPLRSRQHGSERTTGIRSGCPLCFSLSPYLPQFLFPTPYRSHSRRIRSAWPGTSTTTPLRL